MTATLQHSLVRLENLQKLMELQQDLVGVESLVAPGRVSGSVRTCPSQPLRCWHRGVSHTAYPLTIRPVDFSVFEGVQTPPTQRSPGTLGSCSRAGPGLGRDPSRPLSTCIARGLLAWLPPADWTAPPPREPHSPFVCHLPVGAGRVSLSGRGEQSALNAGKS